MHLQSIVQWVNNTGNEIHKIIIIIIIQVMISCSFFVNSDIV